MNDTTNVHAKANSAARSSITTRVSTSTCKRMAMNITIHFVHYLQLTVYSWQLATCILVKVFRLYEVLVSIRDSSSFHE